MSSIKRLALPLAAVSFALVAFLASTTSAYAFVLPGINASGSPVFINAAKVRVNTNNQSFRINTNGAGRDFTLLAGANSYAGKGSITLKGKYTGAGVLSPGGTVQIKGSIEALGIFGGGNILMSADLTAWNNTDNNQLWGFNTANIVCLAALEAAIGACTSAESVYVELNSIFGGFGGGNFTSSATVHTTIPVPAAAWLFGSALGLLGWVRRRVNATA